MKNILFPHRFRSIGWIMFSSSIIMAVIIYYKLMVPQGIVSIILNDAIIIGGLLGSIFVVCSKEKVEDEMTRAIRLSSLLNVLYAYVIIVISGTLAINGPEYIRFMAVVSIFVPVIFVTIFHLEMNRYNKMSGDEEQD